MSSKDEMTGEFWKLLSPRRRPKLISVLELLDVFVVVRNHRPC